MNFLNLVQEEVIPFIIYNKTQRGGMKMKKIVMILITAFLLVGCGFGTHRQLIDEMKEDMIENKELITYDEIFQYADKDIIKGYVIKGMTPNGKEDLYLLNGVKGIGEGSLDEGRYDYGPISPLIDKLDYVIYEGEYYGHDNSYFIGILFEKVSSVLYKDKELEIQNKEIEVNGEKVGLTMWLMKYPNGEEIDINEFKY